MTTITADAAQARELIDSLDRVRGTLDVLALELALTRLRAMASTLDELRVTAEIAQEIRESTADALAGIERVLATLGMLPAQPPDEATRPAS